MSAANDIALAITTRLQQITVAGGYNTDLGLKVLRGRRRISEGQLPCAVIIERDDEPLEQNRGGDLRVMQNFVLEGHAKCDADNPNDTGHEIIEDIKRVVFGQSFTYGAGNSKVYEVKYVKKSIAPREDGLDVVSAAVEVSFTYVENLRNP